MNPFEPRSDFCAPGKSGIETSLAIMDVLSHFSRGKRTMETETVKEIFRRLNTGGVRYALIGGLAYAQYAPPRATQDIDLIVLSEDLKKVQELFPGCYQRGAAIAGIYEFNGTRFDVQPASRRVQIEVLKSSVNDTFGDVPIKVAALPHLILRKLWASVERPELGKKTQDRADVIQLLEHNSGKVSAQDIGAIARDLLSIAYTAEAASEFRRTVEWLNQILDELKLSDRKFPLDERREKGSS